MSLTAELNSCPPQMVAVRSWEDLKPFSDQVVAIETNDRLMCESATRMVNKTMFAYIGDTLERASGINWIAKNNDDLGFSFHLLMASSREGWTLILTGHYLQQVSSFYYMMRNASSEEVDTIKKVIALGQARFPFIDPKDIFARARL